MNQIEMEVETLHPPSGSQHRRQSGIFPQASPEHDTSTVVAEFPSTLDVDVYVDEGTLIAAAQADPSAFGPLYERYVDKIYRYVYRRVGDHAEAEDLTAQTFQQALAALPTYEWRGLPFGAWLFRIAGNLIIRHRRVRRREVAMEDVEQMVDEHSVYDDPMDAILRQSSNEQLISALRQLNEDQQRALVLKYSHGLKNHEVGTIMGRTEGGVKQLVHRAMIVLRGAMVSAAGDQ